MQATEFQPKLGSVIENRVYTIDELKSVIKQIVSGDVNIGMELSQPRLAEILIKMLDLGVSNNSGSSAANGSSPAFTLQGNATNTVGPIVSLTVQQVISILSEFQASGVNHMKGLVPDPGAIAGTTRYLREDGTWATPGGGGGGSGTNILETELDNTIIRYEVKTGTPVITCSRSMGIQTIGCTGGTIKLHSVTTLGATADLAGDNSFKIVCNGVIGTTKLAYPVIEKWNLSGIAPSDAVPHTVDKDNTPQMQVTAGTAGSSITVRIINLNAFSNWAIKMIW